MMMMKKLTLKINYFRNKKNIYLTCLGNSMMNEFIKLIEII